MVVLWILLNKTVYKQGIMITTVLIDYDSTIYDKDSIMETNLDGILGLNGKVLYRIWVNKIHRCIIHQKYLEHHDNILFHCKLLFDYLDIPFNLEIAQNINSKFESARFQAINNPILYPEAIKTLESLKEKGYLICLSTGFDAREKVDAVKRLTGKEYFTHIFSETILGFLKTKPEFYKKILEITHSKPLETVSIGDTLLSDIRPAKLVGIRTIWINRRMEDTPNETELIADFEVNNLLQAVKIINGL
jgi:FMN phosphatase YigB (HAD superfamily)